MAMNTQQGANFGARTKNSPRKERRKYRPLSDINVTPFVDVMLVLLIVFMVTAPLLTVGVPLDLPKTKAASLNDSDEPLVISINEKGIIFIQETETLKEQLVARLIAISENNTDMRVFIRGDTNLLYGQIMEIMGDISAAGFKRVALLAKMPE